MTNPFDLLINYAERMRWNFTPETHGKSKYVRVPGRLFFRGELECTFEWHVQGGGPVELRLTPKLLMPFPADLPGMQEALAVLDHVQECVDGAAGNFHIFADIPNRYCLPVWASDMFPPDKFNEQVLAGALKAGMIELSFALPLFDQLARRIVPSEEDIWFALARKAPGQRTLH